ncbi:hypothetical protein [Streptomyces monomycini]|uniref:hypothetical protein n=1 Tax=Streptomyces monomycini TaxID=371720 RepID=UPI0004A9FB5F|nr:hypothetical protein [Streptomyces monomycini]
MILRRVHLGRFLHEIVDDTKTLLDDVIDAFEDTDDDRRTLRRGLRREGGRPSSVRPTNGDSALQDQLDDLRAELGKLREVLSAETGKAAS